MDGAVPQLVGDGGHVALAFPDELLCPLDTKPGIPLHDADARLMLEQLLSQRFAHGAMRTDVGQTQRIGEVRLHVGIGKFESKSAVVDLGGVQDSLVLLIARVLDDQLKKEGFKIVLDQLLTAERAGSTLLQFGVVRVRQVGCVALLRLIENDGHQAFCSFGDAQDLVLKILHAIRSADERNHHQTR